MAHPTSLLSCSLLFLCAACTAAFEPIDAPLDALGLAAADAGGQDRRQISGEDIAAAFAQAGQMHLPARLAVARLGETRRGRTVAATSFATVPTPELELVEARLAKGTVWSSITLLSPLFAGSQSPNLNQLRLEAARTHADLLLVYGLNGSEAYRPNALAVLNLALLPAFILPGSDVETGTVGGMALVDVRNGHVYAMAGVEDWRAGTAPSAAKESVLATLHAESRRDVLGRMLDSVRTQLDRGQ